MIELKDKLMTPIRLIKRFFSSIKNLIDYFPIIWNDRNWDHFYFIELIKFKLERMEKFFNSDKAFSMEAKKCANEIREVLNCLKIYEDDNLLKEAWDKHYDKYGELKMEEL